MENQNLERKHRSQVRLSDKTSVGECELFCLFGNHNRIPKVSNNVTAWYSTFFLINKHEKDELLLRLIANQHCKRNGQSLEKLHALLLSQPSYSLALP